MTATAARVSVARRFAGQIEQALADGAKPKQLTLCLTLGDLAHLKRDREVPVADISFAGGVMTFLGVKIVGGGVSESVLQGPKKPA